MVKNLQAKTGKSIERWVSIARATGATKHGALVAALKSNHGLTHGYASLIAFRALESANEPGTSEDPVAAQYEGDKAPLRPIYDALIAAANRLGDDVEISPKKGYVSLRRTRQFAIIQPSTKTRVDVGLNLGKIAPTHRLEPSRGFSAMVSHRVRLSGPREVDAELLRWLRMAYESA